MLWLDRVKRWFWLWTPRRLFLHGMQDVELFFRRARLWSRPTRITIDPGAICNLKCPLCPTGQADSGIVKKWMTLDTFTQVLDRIGKNLVLIRLYNWGEPLLHKDIIAMIREANRRRIEVRLSTNLNHLPEALAGELMQCRIDKIFVSCDGASESTYQKYRRGGSFATLVTNMRLLTEKARLHKNRLTRVIWLFHVFKHNAHEVEAARAMARDLGVEIRVNPMRTDMGKEVFTSTEDALARDAEWVPEDEVWRATAGKQNLPAVPCHSPWKESVITWDGDMLPCCSLYQPEHRFGNVLTDDYDLLWNSPVYVQSREEILGKRENGGSICHTCRLNGYRAVG